MSDTAHKEDPFGLTPVWDAAVAVYHEFKKVCDRHGLRYYMSDGNALGAMRHGGFIPWDDDFDLTMPRPDYIKFIEFAKTELPYWLKFVNWENTPEFKFYFGKVQVTDADMVLEVEKKVGFQLSNGIFVDIFPLDGYPSSIVDKIWLRAAGLCINQMTRYRTSRLPEQRGLSSKIAWIFGAALANVLPGCKTERDLREANERNFLRYDFEKAAFVGRCCTANTVLCRAPMPKRAWGDPRFVEFYKGEAFPLPADTPATLVNEYGDWQQLPPESSRRPSHEYEERCPWWLGPTRSN